MKLQPMGATRKEIHGTPEVASEKDYDKEIVYPEIELSGKLAELMGAADLNAGDTFTQSVQWRVKRHVKTDEDGKEKFSMTLCLEQASKPEPTDEKENSDDEEAEGEDEENTPLSFVEKMALRD